MTDDSEICVVSAAYDSGERPAYAACLERLDESLDKNVPGTGRLLYRGDLPPGARPHAESLYGFKPHAVAAARAAGYKKVAWLDATCWVERSLGPVFDRAQEAGLAVAAAADANLIADYSWQRCLDYFGRDRGHLRLERWQFVAGSLFLFDFDHPDADAVLDSWILAERAGMHGAAGEDIGSHRHDETVLALCMLQRGISPLPHEFFGYDCSHREPGILGRRVVKWHWKSLMPFGKFA